MSKSSTSQFIDSLCRKETKKKVYKGEKEIDRLSEVLSGIDKKAKLSESQEIAFEKYRQGCNIYLTGKAGTGKSYLTKRMIQDAFDRGLNPIVCAPSGIAALNIGGSTIHHVFGVPVSGILDPKNDEHGENGDRTYVSTQKKTNPKCYEMIKEADIIFIDEISMCRGDLFDFIARTLNNMKRLTGKSIQLICIGDFYQLPPVLRSNEADAYYERFKYLYCFQSPKWSEFGMITCELVENFRQKEDVEFGKVLDELREGITDHLSYFDDRYCEGPCEDAITFCPTNRKADDINNEHIRKLAEDGARYTTYTAEIEGDVDKKSYPTAPYELNLVIGERVMMLINDPTGKYLYANGSFGTVIDFSEEDEIVTVKLDRSGVEIDFAPHTWDITRQELVKVEDEKTGEEKKKIVSKVIGTYKQFPIRPCWAITIHKSQGQTFDKINIDCSQSFFADGQLYVALSRCTNKNGLYIFGGRINPNWVKASENIRRFMKAQSDNSDVILDDLIKEYKGIKYQISTTPGDVDYLKEKLEDVKKKVIEFMSH